MLATSRGAFIVTPECLATALIPLYVAGVLTARAALARARPGPGSPRRRSSPRSPSSRLLLLALPPALAASPLFLVHGFHQLVLAVVGVVLLALWREPPAPRRWARAAARAGAALAAAAVLAIVAGAALTSAVLGAARAVAFLAPHTLTELAAPGDAQGALALLPAYQAGLLLALGMTAFAGWRRLLPGLRRAARLPGRVPRGRSESWPTTRASLPTRCSCGRGPSAVPVVLTLAMLRAGRPRRALAPLRPAADGPR